MVSVCHKILVPISIHPPLAGWDRIEIDNTLEALQFQSTHPLRGGTEIAATCITAIDISIHPPLAGWDDFSVIVMNLVGISIHPPLAGWDVSWSALLRWPLNFNPPTPCGVGPSMSIMVLLGSYFNPPTPCGVGPLHQPCRAAESFISIHPPLAGWDVVVQVVGNGRADFNPPTPCGVGQQKHTGKFLLFYAEPIESMGFNKYTSVFRFYKAFLPSFSPKIAVRTPRLYAGHFPFARLNKQHPFGFI